MGSDSGLSTSVNGGRSWAQEAPTLINGAVFAVAFSPDGTTVVCVAPGGVYRNFDGRWGRSELRPKQPRAVALSLQGRRAGSICLAGIGCSAATMVAPTSRGGGC